MAELKIEQAAFKVDELKHVPSTGFISTYTNNAGFVINLFDVSITFGQITVTSSGGTVEDRATITMSIEHAKALVLSLGKLLDNYETQHGPIRGPRHIEQS